MSAETRCDRDDVRRLDSVSSVREPALALPVSARARIVAAATQAYPLEACGVLIGAIAAGIVRVERVARARNRCTERCAYDLDPRDLVAADREARGAGLEVVGIWHSHADEPAVPSERDLRSAWSGWSYVIVEISPGRRGELRAWRLARGELVEQDLCAEERAMEPER